MASATNLKRSQVTLGDAAIVYGKRNNITVPGADQTDPVVDSAQSTSVEAAAAAREGEREASNAAQPSKFAPDAADYNAVGSERSAP